MRVCFTRFVGRILSPVVEDIYTGAIVTGSRVAGLHRHSLHFGAKSARDQRLECFAPREIHTGRNLRCFHRARVCFDRVEQPLECLAGARARGALRQISRSKLRCPPRCPGPCGIRQTPRASRHPTPELCRPDSARRSREFRFVRPAPRNSHPLLPGKQRESVAARWAPLRKIGSYPGRPRRGLSPTCFAITATRSRGQNPNFWYRAMCLGLCANV